jgi:hypothetical protein
MVSLKIFIVIHEYSNIRTKIKLESDSPEGILPFENVTVETVPSEAACTKFRLHFGKTAFEERKPPISCCANSPGKKPWWQRLTVYRKLWPKPTEKGIKGANG